MGSLTGDTRDGFFAGQIGDMDEGVVERCVDMGDAEHEFSFCDLGTERDRVLFLWRLDFFGGLKKEDIGWSATASIGIGSRSRGRKALAGDRRGRVGSKRIATHHFGGFEDGDGVDWLGSTRRPTLYLRVFGADKLRNRYLF